LGIEYLTIYGDPVRRLVIGLYLNQLDHLLEGLEQWCHDGSWTGPRHVPKIHALEYGTYGKEQAVLVDIISIFVRFSASMAFWRRPFSLLPRRFSYSIWSSKIGKET
jgi:hypothetical protein